jgi:hypothetical protein
MAHFGDIHGRKRMFTLSILLMAIPTLLIGCLPTYHAVGVMAPILLLTMRVLQGIAIGGEAPGGWAFVAERGPRRRVGLGGVFGLIAMFLRRWLNETPVFEEMRQRAALSRELPLGSVLKRHGRAVATSMISTWMLTAAIAVVILMTQLLLQKLFGLAPRAVQTANLAGTAALCFSTVAIGAANRPICIRRVSTPILSLLIAAYGLYFGVSTAIAPLRSKSEATGSEVFVQLWSGQSARLGRELPAGELTKQLAMEARAKLRQRPPPAENLS